MGGRDPGNRGDVGQLQVESIEMMGFSNTT